MKPTIVLLTASLSLFVSCASTLTTNRSSLTSVPPQVACASLVGLTIPASAIGLPTSGASILTAEDVSDTDPAGQVRAYCKTTGNIRAVDPAASPIRFEVNLPKSWNQRALQFGGGGTNGSVVTGLGQFSEGPASIATPLARGYVTLGSDSGHNTEGKPPFDTSFALNHEELMNFAQWQVKKTVDVAKYLTQKVYGQKPRYTYFAGGSQGGHEAFDAAQRYPNDYNGVIANYPAYNLQNMWQGALAQAKAVYGNASGVPSTAWSNPAKIANLVSAVYSTCDGLDRLQDGIISNVKACNQKFTFETIKATLRCPEGADTGDTCFSDAQIAALEKIGSPVQFTFAFAGGSTTYPKWPILEGATFTGNHLGLTNTADPSKIPFVPGGTAFQYFPGKGDVTGFITGNMNTDPLAFDPTQWVSRLQEVSSWTDAVSVDYSRFTRHGGKLLLTHGTIDDSITPYNTIAYWQKLVAANGQAAVDKFARFYLIPGKGHGAGLFNAKADLLSALEAWVERGQAPGALVAVDGNTTAGSAATNGRTRPLCQYGSFPKYTGPANPSQAQANDAANFSCTAE
ncbi:tannase/feruloyl esterase family alpha/beta hydrolase [Deinococcus alpinitundrae]|uniref:tannase/feruloyl esterase family alpha/beta hydrolase n=1 Tax=Deinococcus alpinitundrae TaxID=468913 RepID=UPI00137A439D|nr:tannase/feruloyl esterase family alpha/beta hydrolase [Deinococcus alpinitundrae]